MHKEKKLHFLHIPKTGGLSLSSFLLKKFKSHEICPFTHLRSASSWHPTSVILHDLQDEKMSQYKFFWGHLGWVPHSLFSDDEIETITFLRHPVERLISFYNFRVGNRGYTHPCHNYASRWSTFEDLVFDKELGLEIRSNLQTRLFCADFFFQKSFSVPLPPYPELENWVITSFVEIDLTPAQMLQIAIERLHTCAFIGITEHYEESFEQLCMQYKWLPPRKTPKKNASKILIKKDSISQKTLDRVIELNQLDFLFYQEALKIFEERKKHRVSFSRNLLEQEFIKMNPPQEHIKFTFSDIFTGEGWDDVEGVAPHFFSWTTVTLSSLIFSIKKQANLFISFSVLHTLLSDLHEKLIVAANSVPISMTRYFHPNGSLLFEGVIPEHAFCKGDLLEITFSIPEVIRPKDIFQDSTETRTLGFAMSELEIKPIASALLQIRQELFDSMIHEQEKDKQIQLLKETVTLKTKNADAENILQSILNSRFWKWTAPIRKLLQFFHKMKRSKAIPVQS